MLNPGTSLLAIIIISPFNTRRKSPSVRMVIGRVRTTKIGLSSALSSPSTRATIIAVIKFSTYIPLIIKGRINIIIEFNNHFISMFIIFCLFRQGGIKLLDNLIITQAKDEV